MARGVVACVVLAGCSDPAPKPVPTKLAFVRQATGATAGQPFELTVAIQDANGATVGDATQSVTLAFASGAVGPVALGGVLTRQAVAGVATFPDITVDRAGGYQFRASSGTLDAATSGSVTIVAGTPATHIIVAGDNQVTTPNTDVPIKPSVRVTDAFQNGVPGIAVTFAVASGGGAITGASATTNESGIATVGAWTLGAAGTNTLTATAGDGALPVRTFTARVSSVVITAIEPAILTPGASATITGSGFSATTAENVVTVESVPGAVTSSTSTSISFTVPANLPCAPTHQGQVEVSVPGDSGTRIHTIRPAIQRVLGIGEALIIAQGDERRCNEFAAPGALYYVNVFNTSRVYDQLGAQWEVRGATEAAQALRVAPLGIDLRGSLEPSPVDESERLHARILEENIRILERRAPELRSPSGMRRLEAAPTRASAVGDMRTIRLPNVNANFCNQYIEINTRVVYTGTRADILEDVTNTLYNQMDSTYVAIGQEFDATMFGILESAFGNPLAMDGATDADGKIVMVFSQAFNTNFSSLAGFVVSCDFFPRGSSSNQSSNFGQFFYARVPTQAGTLSTQDSPPNWRWSMRSTIIHEVKHIVSFSERIVSGFPFETSWLEESTARLSEELYDRTHYGFAQGENLPYGSPGDPRGPYCGVRGCNGRPRGIARVFEDLNTRWYVSPGQYSPIGRATTSDFSFYNTGWSLLRWAVDHSATPEAAFIKALVKGPERDIDNLEARAGRAFADMLPEWTFAMALDDHPGFTALNGRLHQPSWNLRNVMAGLNQDFPGNYTAWPFNPVSRAFGNFSVLGQTLAGTSSFVSVGGTQTARQLIEFRATTGNLAAPAELGVAFVRIQ